MESFPALVFESQKALREVVRASPSARFLRAPCTLYRTGPAEPPATRSGEAEADPGPAWVVVSEALDEEPVPGLRPVRLKRTGRHLSHAGGPRLAILGEEELPTPLMAVHPVPWTEEPPFEGVAALCRDEGAYRRAVSACLALGHERLRAARLEGGEVLLLVEDPSYFLVQTWHEEELVQVFWRGLYPTVFLPWRHVHPLATRFRGLDVGDRYYLALPDGSWRRFAVSDAEDVYGALELDLASRVERSWEPRGELPEVQVRLFWGFRPAPAEASMWILPDPGAAQVDALVEQLPESELQSLQLAVLTGEEREVFVLRRLATGVAGRSVPPEIPGRALAPYAGYGNLLLPVERLLEPPIRKDRFRTMLGLIPGEVVLLVPDAGEGMELVRFPERAFRSLSSLVEYRIAADQAHLETLLRASVFEFEPLEYTPVRSPAPGEDGREDPAARARREVRRAPVEADDSGVGDDDAGEGDAEEAPPPARPTGGERTARPATPIELEVGEERGGDPRELELETLALDEDDPGPWLELGALKQELGKWSEAVFAHEEALWRHPGVEGAERREYLELLASSLGIEPGVGAEAVLGLVEGRLDGRAEEQSMAARYLAFRLADLDEGEPLRRGLDLAYRALRDSRHRRKARWMAWSEVLARSLDATEEERQREEILGSLSRRGLDPEDRPPFLGRYLRGRAGIEEWSEQADLPALLGLLSDAAFTIPAGPFRLEAQTLVFRTRLEAEREGREGEILEELQRLVARPDAVDLVSLCNYAGALSHLASEDGARVFQQLYRRVREAKEASLQDRVFNHLFRNLVFAERFSGVQSVIQGSLELLRELSPPRRARVLAEVTPQLVELGARQEAAELAEELLGLDAIRDDLFFVERCAVALRAAMAPDPMPDELWAVVGSSVEASRDRFDPLYLDLVEDCALALGEPFIQRLEARVAGDAEGGAYAGLILGACQLRILAETGRAREGLDTVENALGACWALPEAPTQARSLSRYVRAVAHFGNPERGSRILAGVIEAANARDGRELDDFYRAEILGEVARTAGQLGEPERAVEVLERILDGVQARIGGGRDDAALLFEVLSIGIEVLLELGEWSRGAPLVERVEEVISGRIGGESGVHRGPWFYLHRGRLVCSRALLFMGREERGTRALLDALEGFKQVSALDRPDLLKESARVLPFIDGAVRREALGRIVELMRKMEDYGEYDRRCRAEVVAALATAIRPGADAYRREQARWDAMEARSIRHRVARGHPARVG